MIAVDRVAGGVNRNGPAGNPHIALQLVFIGCGVDAVIAGCHLQVSVENQDLAAFQAFIAFFDGHTAAVHIDAVLSL